MSKFISRLGNGWTMRIFERSEVKCYRRILDRDHGGDKEKSLVALEELRDIIIECEYPHLIPTLQGKRSIKFNKRTSATYKDLPVGVFQRKSRKPRAGGGEYVSNYIVAQHPFTKEIKSYVFSERTRTRADAVKLASRDRTAWEKEAMSGN